MELPGGRLVALLLLLFYALSSVQATSLIQALQNAGASQFAAEIQANPAASAIYFSNRVQTVFAPTDGSSNSTTSKLRRRQSDPAALQRLLYHCTANINTLAAMSFGSGLAMMSNDNSPQLGGKSQEFVSTPIGKSSTNSCPSQQLVDRNSNDTDWPWWPWHTVYVPTSIYVTVPVTVYISVPVTQYVSVYITVEDTQTVYIKAPTTVLTTLLSTVHETDFITFSTTQVTTVHDTNSVTISTTVFTTVHDTDSITISNIDISTVHDIYPTTISNIEVTTVHETGFVTLTTTDFITVPTTEVTTVPTTLEEISLVTVSTTDFITVPTTEVITLEQTATITIPTTLLSTVPTTVVTTQISTLLLTVPTTIVTSQFLLSTVPTTVVTTQISTLLSTVPTTVFTTQFSTVPTTVPTTIATTVSTEVPTTVLSTISTELSTTIFSTVYDTELVTVSTEIPTTIVSTVTSKVPTTVSTVVTTRLLPTATPSLVKISSGLGNSVNIIQADIPYDGGIIHIIDDSFTLPESLTDTANVNGQTAFTGLASSYNLTNTLDNTPEITYFIPSNSAFAMQGATSSYPSIESLLLGHLIPSFAGYLPSLSDGSTYKSQAGSEFTVTIKGTDYYINNAKIILANVIVANGVAHVIDEVIQPLATQTAHPSSGSSLRDEPLRLMIVGWSIVMFLLGFILL